MEDSWVRNRSLLRRRDSVFATLQAGLDGTFTIVLVYSLSVYTQGYFSYQYLFFVLALLAAIGLIYDRFGIYRRQHTATNKAIRLGEAWSLAFGLLLAIAFLTKTSELFSRQLLLITYAVGYVGQLGLHLGLYAVRRRLKAAQAQNHALIIGEGRLANYLYERINRNPWISERIVGAVSLEARGIDQLADSEVHEEEEQSPKILGSISDVTHLVDSHHIRGVYIVAPLDASPKIGSVYGDLLDRNVDIHWAPNIFALNLINHSVKEIGGIPVITLSETPLLGSSLILKSLLDKSLAMVAIILLSPLMLVLAAAVKYSSPGPVFFRQRRRGWNGQPFSIYKFRSMYVHQEEGGAVTQASQDDPRCTRIGRLIRRTSMDELPQLFNVLNGTMSLVGPRPHAMNHDDDYSRRIATYFARQRIKPGITGLAQVRGFRGETSELDLMAKRIESDIEYINNWSVWLDVIILARTTFALTGNRAC